MRHVMKLALAASVSVVALGWTGLQSANAADMVAPQEQAQMPPSGYYGSPPVAEGYGYPPPPAVYGYPPPPSPPVAYYAYPAPAYWGWPGPYYWRGLWRGYGPRVAYGYGHWGRGFRR